VVFLKKIDAQKAISDNTVKLAEIETAEIERQKTIAQTL
jgi:hypothetical protein